MLYLALFCIIIKQEKEAPKMECILTEKNVWIYSEKFLNEPDYQKEIQQNITTMVELTRKEAQGDKRNATIDFFIIADTPSNLRKVEKIIKKEILFPLNYKEIKTGVINATLIILHIIP